MSFIEDINDFFEYENDSSFEIIHGKIGSKKVQNREGDYVRIENAKRNI